jgi:peroxiredoxin
MTRKLLLLPALALTGALATVPAAADLAVGSTAPAFTLEAVDGSKVALADLKGKTVVLEWTNPNCPFVDRHAKAKTMVTTAGKHQEVVWLAINSTHSGHKDYLEPAKHQAWAKEHGITYGILYDRDGKVGQAYDAKTTPHMFVIDGSGKVVYNGAIDDSPRGGTVNVNYVDSGLTLLAQGGAPNPATTKPYGCSVKY